MTVQDPETNRRRKFESTTIDYNEDDISPFLSYTRYILQIGLKQEHLLSFQECRMGETIDLIK